MSRRHSALGWPLRHRRRHRIGLRESRSPLQEVAPLESARRQGGNHEWDRNAARAGTEHHDPRHDAGVAATDARPAAAFVSVDFNGTGSRMWRTAWRKPIVPTTRSPSTTGR